MFRRSLLSHTRTRPFSSLTAAAARIPSTSLLIQPSTAAASRLQWRTAMGHPRWSSTDASAAESTPAPQPAATGSESPSPAAASTASSAAAPAVDTAKMQKDLEAKTKEAAEFKDKFLRSVADFRNLQERTVREVKSAKEFAIQKFAKDLLESIDNLDRALVNSQASTTPDPAKDFQNLYDGLKMTETVLMGTLAKHGLVRFDPMGEKFNPNMHEATFEVPMEGKEAGSVFHVQTKGFQLNGRVLRAAQVGVVKAP
ncbi:hypothetical protein DRE_03171 [Drechslerella stenobrocha 248]|uniref:GrpE protein homolog n=1 Tax=Drechslerella stenobrocha 248 TaxID=1043628 RepID=W7HTT1_9PEZI|nr:hypothetical protein DRE_03171 [Drechslerella stenobrocha 248]